MITIEDWVDFKKGKISLFYWDGEFVNNFKGDVVRYDTTHDVWISTNGVWFRDIYKTEKECAEAVIKQLKERYL